MSDTPTKVELYNFVECKGFVPNLPLWCYIPHDNYQQCAESFGHMPDVVKGLKRVWRDVRERVEDSTDPSTANLRTLMDALTDRCTDEVDIRRRFFQDLAKKYPKPSRSNLNEVGGRYLLWEAYEDAAELNEMIRAVKEHQEYVEEPDNEQEELWQALCCDEAHMLETHKMPPTPHQELVAGAGV